MMHLMIGIVTTAGKPWALDENYQRMAHYAREAAERGAELVIAPENVLDGYVAGAAPDVTREKMLGIAQTVPDGPYIQRGCDLARELAIYLIFGFLERVDERLYNTCILIDPQGALVARYRKVNPLNEMFITPGHELQPFETPFGRVGFLICGDRGVLDNFRTLAVQGAQIIFIPMDGGYDPNNLALLQGRAADNGVGIIIANTHGSGIISPRGVIMHQRFESECVSVQRFCLSELGHIDRSHFQIRRPDLYGPLATSIESTRHWNDVGEPTDHEEQQRKAWNDALKARSSD